MRVEPSWAIPGGRLNVHGSGFLVGPGGPPHVRIGGHDARVTIASPDLLSVIVPVILPGGSATIDIEGEVVAGGEVVIARQLTTGIHQVDNPAFDGLGRLYVTDSGGRGVKSPIPIYRVGRHGTREGVAIEIANPTSLALGPDGAMYVSSRFEGSVQRLTTDDRVEPFATELGVATGLAFAADGSLFVGDRSGSIFRITRERQVETFATLPGSVAAFHLAFGPDGCLYVSAPSLASHDPIYRITPDRLVDVMCEGFGRPQGLAFDSRGDLYVVDALAGAAGLFRVDLSRSPASPERVVTAPSLVGVAFDPEGGVVLASSDTIWRLDVPLRPLSISRP